MKLLRLYKNAFGGLSREVWLLSAVMLINRTGTMVVAFLSLYLTQAIGLSVRETGIVMLCFGTGALTGTWIGGRLTDRVGAYFVQFWSLAIGGVLFLVMSTLTDFYLLCLVAFLLSTFGEAYRPANQVSIAHFSSPGNFTRSTSLVRLAINLGWSLGPLIGGFVAFYNFKWLFWIDGLTNLMAAAMVFLFLKPKVKPKPKAKTSTQLFPADSPYRDKPFLWFILFNTTFAMCFFPLFTVMGLYYKEVIGLNTKEIGVLLGLNGLIVVIFEMVFLYKIKDKFKPISMVLIGTVFLILNFLVIFFFKQYAWMLLAVLLVSISEMFAMPFMNTITIQRAKEHNRGQYSGLNSMSWAVAQMTAPLISTQIIDGLGYTALLYFFIALSTFTTIGFAFLRNRI